MLRALSISIVLAAAVSGVAAAAEPPCDVIVAGGSLASLAAAVTAANSTPAPAVCFLELTDWPGGQLTASGVPCPDFGPDNGQPNNLPKSFADFLWGPSMPGDTNLGRCWVSKKCMQAPHAIAAFVMPLLAALPNLRVYMQTAVLHAARDSGTGAVTGVTAVRRTAVAGTTGYELPLSQQVEDWYSPATSARFTKETLELVLSPSGIVIEATEFGDVLSTGGLPLAQGIEAPLENSTASITSCGQAMTYPFSVMYSAAPAPSPDPVPQGSAEGEPWGSQGLSWARVWTYRRSLSAPTATIDDVVVGDISCMNVGGGNDAINVYQFLPTDSPEFARQRATPTAWRGGVNVTALHSAEQRAFAFYHHYITSPNASGGTAGHLSMAAEQMGTGHGLSKMPYLRDARRSAAGLGGFRLTYADLANADPRNKSYAVRWPDTVAIGTYFYADIHKMDPQFCALPPYLTDGSGAAILPYFIPFRALTVAGAPNLLVAGKSLAQTFWASAGTRLHPEEWATGVAAGAAAAWMARLGLDSAAALARVGELQAILAAAGQPLYWSH